MPSASVPAAVPARKYSQPFFTYGLLFNVIGWIVLSAILFIVVIPGLRGGNWTPFIGPDKGAIWYFLYEGLLVTLRIGIISIALSTAFGFLFALGRLSNVKPLRVFCSSYIEFMRALPSYLIIFYVFIVFPKFGVKFEWGPMNILGLTSDQWFAIVGLSLYTSAVMAEIFRAGILSVEKGQLEAAYALGLKPRDTVVSIILPQAFRKMVPSIVSQLITLTKDTSLASVIAVQELTRKGKQLAEMANNVLETMFVVAAIYFVICYSLSLLSKRLEVKQ